MPLPSGWTNEALLEEILAGPWQVPSPLADTRAIDRDDWRQRITPSLKQGGFNEVAFCRVEACDADALIDRTIDEYARLGLRFRWTVTPGSAPDDLAERLARRGFARVEIRGMARDLAPIARAGGATVELVDASTVDDFTDVMAEGWSMDPAPLRPLHRAMVERAPDRYRLFLVREGRVPVGVGGYAAAPRSVYQMGAVVLPAFRGRGCYPALVAARLADAAARGIALATSQAREETSAPILERLGFVTVCRFPSFTSPSP